METEAEREPKERPVRVSLVESLKDISEGKKPKIRVHILGPSEAEIINDESVFVEIIHPFVPPPSSIPEGMSWHPILNKFVLEEDANKEMTLDIEEIPLLYEEYCGKEKEGRDSVKDSVVSSLEAVVQDESPEKAAFSARTEAQLASDKEEALARANPLPTEKERIAAKHQRTLDGYARYFEKFPLTREEEDSLNEDLDVLFQEAGDEEKRAKSLMPLREQYDLSLADYKNLCRDTLERIEDVRRLLRDERYDDAKAAYRMLDKRKTEIDEAADKVHDEYRKLTAAVCDALEYGDLKGTDAKDRVEKTLATYKDPAARLASFAPIRGEDVKAYSERLAASNREGELPKTLANFDKHIKAVERRWQRVAALSDAEMDVVRLNWRKTIDLLTKRYVIASELSLRELEGLLVRGYLTADSRPDKEGVKSEDRQGIIRTDSDIVRFRLTKAQFDIQGETTSEDLEKYAFFIPNSPSVVPPGLGGCGEAIVRWDDDSICATFYCGDSLLLNRDGMNYCNCSLLSDPSPCSINPENTAVVNDLKKGALDCGLNELCRRLGIPFIEVQLHGTKKPTRWDVSSIDFTDANDIRNLSYEAMAEIEEMEIPIYLLGKPIGEEKGDGETDGAETEENEAPKQEGA